MLHALQAKKSKNAIITQADVLLALVLVPVDLLPKQFAV